jgi:aerobic C4-dicarboxylate transport protein
MALILGIDRFMSEARALVNMIGNGVATIVIARSEGELNHAQLNTVLAGADSAAEAAAPSSSSLGEAGSDVDLAPPVIRAA